VNWRDKDGTPYSAAFSITPETAEFGLLAPSIERMVVDERNVRLMIYGLFGSDPSNVKVTMNSVTIPSQWKSIGEIWATLPTTGPNTGGDVRVSVGGHASNIVRLTEWKGTIQVAARSGGSGTLGYTLNYSFHVRGDIHSFRSHAHQTPLPQSLLGIDGVGDSFAAYTVGGSQREVIDLGGCSQIYEDSWATKSDTMRITNIPFGNLAIGGRLRPLEKTLTLYLGCVADSAITYTFSDSLLCPDTPPQGAHFVFPVSLADNDTLELSMDDSYNLLAMDPIQRPWVSYSFSGAQQTGTLTVTFAGAAAINPPDPKAAQRAAPMTGWINR
jgi:hypothetical protein